MAKRKTNHAETLYAKVEDRTAVVGIIGLGYVGLPLAFEFGKAGFPVIGFDVDIEKTRSLKAGKTYIEHIPSESVKEFMGRKSASVTTDFARLAEADCILICVPTPLTHHRDPDMSYINQTVKVITKYLRPGQLVCLESTTYPGTSKEVVQPPLEAAGGVLGEDLFIAYSPEREDPGNPNYGTSTIPKVVGGMTPACRKIACALYDGVVVKTVPVSSCAVAEATKLVENIFRSVNIAMVNELKVLFDKMGINIWEVVEAAKSKPFGYMPFYPGPGLGGHCIPIDPFYLTWRAREYETPTRFIELAGEINTAMPYYVIERTMSALNEDSKSLKGSKVLLLGAAYKADVDDMRESPSLKLIELLRERGAKVDYCDPHVPELTPTREYDISMKAKPLTAATLKKADVVLISTAHKAFDYRLIGQHAKLVVDTRNAMANNGVKRCAARVERA